MRLATLSRLVRFSSTVGSRRLRASHTIATSTKSSRTESVIRMVGEEFQKFAPEKLIHVTTTGRKTRNPRTVELWFAVRNGKVYLSHEGSETDWMKNIENNDQILFEIGGKNFTGRARILENGTEEAWEAKAGLYEKYYGKAPKEIIEDWFSLSRLITIEPS